MSFDEVRKIRAAFAAGTKLEELAGRHDVASPIMWHVDTGATYSNKTGPTFEINQEGEGVRKSSPRFRETTPTETTTETPLPHSTPERSAILTMDCDAREWVRSLVPTHATAEAFDCPPVGPSMPSR